MKKQYQHPTTALQQVATAILCASNPSRISPKGSLESIRKSNGEW